MCFKSAATRAAVSMVLVAVPVTASFANPATFGQEYGAFVERLIATPHAPPGFAVVVFHEGRTVFEKAYGVRNARTGAPMTLDTPIYNASLTKAYTGVLAALLHKEGKLPLETTLARVWPGLSLPSPLNPQQVTMAKLLSHSSGMIDTGLLVQSNQTGQIDQAAIPAHIAAHSRVVPNFQYSNFGPFLYSAVAEKRTGETWHQGIKRRVLDPLGLRRTSTTLEAFPANEVAQCHVIRGGKWTTVPPKPTAVLNAAGGVYASARDTAKFMKAFTTGGRSARGKISADVLRHTWQPQSIQDVTFAGLKRDSYGLGWDLGAYDGRRYVSRSGGYYGCRSYALFMPELGFGVAVLSVGDTGVNTLNVALLKHAIDLWTGHAETKARASERVASYHALVALEAAKLQGNDPRLANPPPLNSMLASRAVGAYRNSRLGVIQIARTANGLTLRAGALKGDLVPLGKEDFLFLDHAGLDVTSLRFVGSGQNPFDSLILDDDQFDRVNR